MRTPSGKFAEIACACPDLSGVKSHPCTGVRHGFVHDQLLVSPAGGKRLVHFDLAGFDQLAAKLGQHFFIRWIRTPSNYSSKRFGCRRKPPTNLYAERTRGTQLQVSRLSSRFLWWRHGRAIGPRMCSSRRIRAAQGNLRRSARPRQRGLVRSLRLNRLHGSRR